MTIQVEQRETLLLRVVERKEEESAAVVVDYANNCGPSKPLILPVPKVSDTRTTTAPEDDTASVTTSSTFSSSDDDSSAYTARRVCFADQLVTDVWTRPRTPREDLSALYYSSDETQR